MELPKAIDKLHKFHTLSVLDYGAEAKDTDERVCSDERKHENHRDGCQQQFSACDQHTKLTSLVDNSVLEPYKTKQNSHRIKNPK